MISAYFLEKSWYSPTNYVVKSSIIANHDNCASIKITYSDEDGQIYPFRDKDFAINLKFVNTGYVPQIPKHMPQTPTD